MMPDSPMDSDNDKVELDLDRGIGDLHRDGLAAGLLKSGEPVSEPVSRDGDGDSDSMYLRSCPEHGESWKQQLLPPY
jgi:hypothetical protein